MPRFSILVPVYNVQDYVDQCLGSILKQSFDDYEVIIVNDGSTDDSLEVCQDYARRDNRFLVVSQENEGLLRARRRGLREARGEYVLFLDSDDFWEPDALSSIEGALSSTSPSPDLLVFNFYRYSKSHGQVMREPIFQNGTLFDVLHKEEFIEEWINTGDLNAMWTKAVKRSCIDVDDGYDDYVGLSTGEDLLQSIYIVSCAQSILYIDKPLYNYRMNEGSITHSFNLRKVYQLIQVRERFWYFLQNSSFGSRELLSEYLKVSAEVISGYLLDVYANASIQDITECNRRCEDSELVMSIKRNGSFSAKPRLVFYLLSGNNSCLASAMGRAWKVMRKGKKSNES